MAKKSKIVQPDSDEAVQMGLFSATNLGDLSRLKDYPPVYRDIDGFKKVIAGVTDMCGLDFEFNPATLKPTVIGVSNYTECAAIFYTQEIMEWLETERKSRGFRYSGHAVLTADRQVLEKSVKSETTLATWSDSMLTFWLANADLCKNPGKEVDEEGGLGFMGLGTMVSLTTDLPHHKTHRGRDCEELICPRCLRGESLVFMADGTTRRIADLTTNRVQDNVLAFDGKKLVPARITNWFKSPQNNRKFVRVSYTSAIRGGHHSDKSGVVLTEDHKVLTRRGWIAAGELLVDDRIATGTNEYSENAQKILPGLLLGDSNSRKSKLTLVHGSEQLQYLKLKSKVFGDVPIVARGDWAFYCDIPGTPFGLEVGNEFRTNWSSWLCRNFNLESAAIWFLDDGSLHKYQGVISVASYEETEIQFLVALLGSVIPEGRVTYRINDTSTKRRRVIYLNSEAMAWFSSAISAMVPPCLRYKIAHPRVVNTLRDFNSELWEPGEVRPYYAPAVTYPETGRINYRTGKEEDQTVHCIEVEGYHNFLTVGGIVQNCDVRGYCAIDAYGGLLGDVKSRSDLHAFGVPVRAIQFQHEIQELSHKMSAYGVNVDREYVKTLAAGMVEEQEKLFPSEGEEGFTFNPRSPKAITDWGKANKIYFPGTDKDNVQTILEKMAADYGYAGDKFDEIRELLDNDFDKLDPILNTVYRLYTYKILGKGVSSWFDDRYFGSDNLLHPRFVVTGTSTGRFSSSRPNYQNIPKRGWGKRVRRAFVPRDPNNVLVESDFSQLELRVCLYLAGVDQSIIGHDAFSWLVSKSEGLFDKAAQRYGGKARDIAKSMSHAGNYLEGLRLLEPTELDYARVKSEIAAGALRVYHPKYMPGLKKEWTYCGKIVSFTGSNLAQRLFKSKTFENRKKALEIQEDVYFATFNQIRGWQQSTLAATEGTDIVKSPAGRFLRLNDTPEKNAKITVAFLGQGVGASHMQSIMLQYYKRYGTVFLGSIHDALLAEFPLAEGYRNIYDFMKEMEHETPLLPGFSCPCKIEVGRHWGAMEELQETAGELFLGKEKVK